jgi:ferredoxin
MNGILSRERRPGTEMSKPKAARRRRKFIESPAETCYSAFVFSNQPVERHMIEIVEKHWPMSVGDGKATRKKKPRILAITTDCCTGCAGSPACIEYCPIDACMFWVPDDDHTPFGRIEVDPYLCIGCQKCISKGPDGAFLDGCPWDAIEMVPTEDWEAMHGVTLPDAPPPAPQ